MDWINLPSAKIALPAVAATAAYLNAKYNISYDLHLVSSIIRSRLASRQAAKTGKHNAFYRLEEIALDPKTSGRAFLIYQGRSWTYKEAYEIVLKYGTWFTQKHGVRPGETVALDCMNRPEFIWIWFGLWSIGAKVGKINYNLKGTPLMHSVKTSGARLLVVDDNVKGNLDQPVMDGLASPGFYENGDSVKVVLLSAPMLSEILEISPVREPDSAREVKNPLDMAMLIYTSGTTGLPKAAVVNWDRVTATTVYVSSFLGMEESDVFYSCLPLYHSAGSVLATLNCLFSKCTLSLGHRFSTKTYWQEVHDSNATIIQYIGEVCRYLLSAQPSPLDRDHKVRFAFGNGLRPDIWAKFKERFGIETIYEFYGATEGPASSWNRSRNDRSKGSIGRTGPLIRTLFGKRAALVEHDVETEAPVRDAKTGFCKEIDTSLPDSPAGEYISRLGMSKAEIEEVFAGYYGNPKSTDSKILRDVFQKGDAWFRSGDLLRRSPEGYMYFHDRIGDTFRWRGENVSTNEVSDVLGQHDALDEANVYGVALPNHDGRAGCANIVLKGGSTDVSQSTLRSLASHVQKSLPKYAVPLFLRVAKQTEVTGTTKHMKFNLRQDGVDPNRVQANGDRIYWLNGDTYQPFQDRDWQSIKNGETKL